MHKLEKWIVHRAGVIGLSWPDGVAEGSGVSSAMLLSITTHGRLRKISRSARGYLARALKVSIRELEELADGKIRWIDDDHTVDLDRLSPYAAGPVGLTLPTVYHCREGKGVAILGRVMQEGVVEPFESWTPEDGPRLPVRYRGLPDAFAMELAVEIPPYATGTHLAFRVIAPGELADNELALLTLSDRESETRLGRVRLLSQQSLCLLPDEHSIHPLGDVLRAARVIDAR